MEKDTTRFPMAVAGHAVWKVFTFIAILLVIVIKTIIEEIFYSTYPR